MQRLTSPAAAGVTAILLWCSTGVCFAAGGRAMGPMAFTTAICLVGFAAGCAMQIAQGRPLAELFRLPARVWAAGFLGISVYTVLLVLAVGIAPDRDMAQVALANYLWPVFIVALERGLPGARASASVHGRRALAGALLGFAGVALARGADVLARPPSSLLPHAMAAGGALLWALYSVALRRWRIPAETNGSTAQWLLCSALAATVGAMRGEWESVRLTPQAAAWALYCGIGPVGVGYACWEIGAKRGPAHLLATLAFFIPVGSALLMGLAFREALGPTLLPGAALIAAGAWLAGGQGRRQEKEETHVTQHDEHAPAEG